MEKIDLHINVMTGECTKTVTQVTDAEIAQAQAEIASWQAIKDAKESALAKLAALGLTQDEVKALVG
jgi:hypothetical protein